MESILNELKYEIKEDEKHISTKRTFNNLIDCLTSDEMDINDIRRSLRMLQSSFEHREEQIESRNNLIKRHNSWIEFLEQSLRDKLEYIKQLEDC